jgi:hypothetical protein
MPQLEGLTHEQVVLCDLLWNSDDPTVLIAAMPTQQRRTALTLMQMITLAEIDDIVLTMTPQQINRTYLNLFG